MIYSWLVPLCADIMSQSKTGSDGRTAYEKLTGHKCKQVAIGFAEVADYILEPSKGHMHKADTRVMKGVFLRYEWRTTEYIVGTADGTDCMHYLKLSCGECILEGARTNHVVRFA